ncbi:hypothetical protein [Plantactinospora soyae]|uniref:hypothetical protein n=1 Tax=Plantactinospora soyae TaxID=1544732 RepID=UPI00178A281B|nr:hypothetical protein [Plantactinospora soyae]
MSVLALAGAPAQAARVSCQGECTTGAILSNRPGNYIDVLVINGGLAPGYCTWQLRDTDAGQLVASGTTWDGEQDSPRITGLYNAYYLFVSNWLCHGTIDNV